MSEPEMRIAPPVLHPITPAWYPRLYLAGPMTGLPNFNFSAFRHQAVRLREMGFKVICPSETFAGDQGRPYMDYMRVDIRSITRVDAVALLPGWTDSPGVRIETTVAAMLDLPLVSVLTLKPVSRCPCKTCAKARHEGMSAGDRMTFGFKGMVLCPTCGNKRCPHAAWHGFKCSHSNSPGQVAVPIQVAVSTQSEAPTKETP